MSSMKKIPAAMAMALVGSYLSGCTTFQPTPAPLLPVDESLNLVKDELHAYLNLPTPDGSKMKATLCLPHPEKVQLELISVNLSLKSSSSVMNGQAGVLKAADVGFSANESTTNANSQELDIPLNVSSWKQEAVSVENTPNGQDKLHPIAHLIATYRDAMFAMNHQETPCFRFESSDTNNKNAKPKDNAPAPQDRISFVVAFDAIKDQTGGETLSLAPVPLVLPISAQIGSTSALNTSTHSTLSFVFQVKGLTDADQDPEKH